ncbi:hypothetical protein KAI46_12355 [bacterium]|nr:hypothetical protein [bacterium]
MPKLPKVVDEAWINREERIIFTTVESHREGKIFDDMKTWNPEKHPGHAAVALKVEEVYSGADKVFG